MKAIPFLFLSEPLSSLLHLGGAVVALVMLPVMLRRVGRPWTRVLAYSTFCLGALAQLLVSGIYHATEPGTLPREVLQRADHAAIFLLIAGTYTPVVMEHHRGMARRALMVMIWTLALGGALAKTIWFSVIPEWAGLLWYLALGWAGLVGGGVLARRVGVRPLLPLVWGGVAYSVGAAMEGTGWPVLVPGILGPHELFHVGVLAGLFIHGWFLFHAAAQFRDAPA